jgi:hypothetical protein
LIDATTSATRSNILRNKELEGARAGVEHD